MRLYYLGLNYSKPNETNYIIISKTEAVDFGVVF